MKFEAEILKHEILQQNEFVTILLIFLCFQVGTLFSDTQQSLSRFMRTVEVSDNNILVIIFSLNFNFFIFFVTLCIHFTKPDILLFLLICKDRL